jgi:hypothetical protein
MVIKVGLLIYEAWTREAADTFYDRMLVDRLKACGDQVEIVSCPGATTRHLGDNLSAGLRRAGRPQVDILLQDEPTILRFWLNRRARPNAFSGCLDVHHLQQRGPPPGRPFHATVERPLSPASMDLSSTARPPGGQ